MNELMKKIEELALKQVENHELKQEIGQLSRMIKIGFESKPVGMEKVSKVFASNDEEKIKKFYDSLASSINGLHITGNFEKFADYMMVTHGIVVSYPSNEVPISYVTKGKKAGKFADMYNSYFLEEKPFKATDALHKILSAIKALTQQFTLENEEVKDSLNDITASQSEYSHDVIKMIDSIIIKSKIKAVEITEATSDIEDKINNQQCAVHAVHKLMDGSDE
jgi:hypothetical protein